MPETSYLCNIPQQRSREVLGLSNCGCQTSDTKICSTFTMAARGVWPGLYTQKSTAVLLGHLARKSHNFLRDHRIILLEHCETDASILD